MRYQRNGVIILPAMLRRLNKKLTFTTSRRHAEKYIYFGVEDDIFYLYRLFSSGAAEVAMSSR